MQLAKRNDLLKSIVDTIVDYRRSEGIQITPSHVNRWVSQFDDDDQGIILQEMDRLLRRFYYSRTRVKKSLRSYIRKSVIGDSEPLSALSRTRFLRVQRKGNSQKDLLEIVDEILREDHGTCITDCGTGSPDTFVYIDDGIYTGNRLRYDLTPGTDAPAWIASEAPDGCTLKIYVLASHKAGEKYAMGYIRARAGHRGITINLNYDMQIANDRQLGDAQRLWPRAMAGNVDVDSYVTHVRGTLTKKGWSDSLLFRPSHLPTRETLFISSGARETIERAFLVKGAELIKSTDKESMRPLGWEKIPTLGLGTLLVTYRNIANNTPPVLWWTGSNWHPLFSRRDSAVLEREHGGNTDPFDDIDDLPF